MSQQCSLTLRVELPLGLATISCCSEPAQPVSGRVEVVRRSTDQVLERTRCGKVEPDPRSELLDACADLEQAQLKGVEADVAGPRATQADFSECVEQHVSGAV